MPFGELGLCPTVAAATTMNLVGSTNRLSYGAKIQNFSFCVAGGDSCPRRGSVSPKRGGGGSRPRKLASGGGRNHAQNRLAGFSPCCCHQCGRRGLHRGVQPHGRRRIPSRGVENWRPSARPIGGRSAFSSKAQWPGARDQHCQENWLGP